MKTPLDEVAKVFGQVLTRSEGVETRRPGLASRLEGVKGGGLRVGTPSGVVRTGKVQGRRSSEQVGTCSEQVRRCPEQVRTCNFQVRTCSE